MLSEKFTLLELTDLALRVPEVGAVNFNILYTVLSTLLLELGLADLRTPCRIENEALAQVLVTRARLDGGSLRKSSKIHTTQEMKGMLKQIDTGLAGEDSSQKEPVVRRDLPLKNEGEMSDAPGTGLAPEEMKRSNEVVGEAVEEGGNEAIGEEGEERTEDNEVSAGEAPSKEEEEDKQPYRVDKHGEEDQTLADTEEPVVELGSVAELKIGEELQDTAREILKQKADVLVEVVAQRILGEGENLLESESSTRPLEELWRATNVNRRLDAAEVGLREISRLVDIMMDKIGDMEEQSDDAKTGALFENISEYLARIEALEEACRTIDPRIDDCNEKRALEVERLEGIIKELEQEDTKSALEALKTNFDDLEKRVSRELEKMRNFGIEAIESKMKEMKGMLREMQETLVKKEDFGELAARVEELEENKVSREELGRFLEPGFLDSFLEEQANLRNELEEQKLAVAELESNLEALNKRIEEEILQAMKAKFSEVQTALDTINAKLALLDPDEINDSFADLEDRMSVAEMTLDQLSEMKVVVDQFHKEAKINFNKISNMNELLNRLVQTKADTSKIYELLEQKADVNMIMNKVDRSELVAVRDMNENLETLTIKVKINEEEMDKNFADVRHELSLKMYTQDFITATEPIRNRIRALKLELEGVKQITLTRLFPDAPGVVKCISCKRGAHLAGPKYVEDAHVEEVQQVPPRSKTKRHTSGKLLKKPATVSTRGASDIRLPPVDLEMSVPIPPPDEPREMDPLRLPILLAMARPQVGLAHSPRRSDIDKRLAAYFATRPIRICDGEHTRTDPQQRGLAFKRVELCSEASPGSSKDTVKPTVVSLHLDGEPLQDPTSLTRSRRHVSLPNHALNKALPSQPR